MMMVVDGGGSVSAGACNGERSDERGLPLDLGVGVLATPSDPTAGSTDQRSAQVVQEPSFGM